MKKFIKDVLLRQRQSRNVVKKTDDELTRYIKQKRIIKDRRHLEEELSLETLTKTERMNTREIRMQHYVKLQNLDKQVYDKPYINDNMIDYDYLVRRDNYRPIGQRFRPFILLPPYARMQDWEYSAGINRYLARTIMGLLCIGLGYKFGTWDSKDELLAKSNVVEFESEDQIFDILHNQKKSGVFLYLYSPGMKQYEDFNNVFDRESSKYSLTYRRQQDSECEEDEEDDIVFMRVHCRKHLNFCLNKQWAGRIQPSAEVYSLSEEKQISIVDFDNQHRSAQGIEGFFTKQGLIEDRFNPEELLERGGRKFIQLI